MKVGIIGTGYIGLIVGASLASSGNHVVGYDIDAARIGALGQGEVPIKEPGLEAIVRQQLRCGRLRFTTRIEDVMQAGELLFITVPTPATESGAADLSQVSSVAAQLGDHIDGFKVIVIKSTVPVGTADLVESIIISRATQDFAVVSNPEFLREGTALADFREPSRIIIGTSDERARAMLGRLYRPFVRENQRVFFMDRRSAELTKYATNAMLALRVSFMNEMSALCEATGADIDQVRLGVGSDPRIGWSFLFPGLGYGGSCFPKDIEALISVGREYNTPVPILEAAQHINSGQRERFLDKLLEFFAGDLEGRVIAVWGATYKPNSPDIRDSPAVDLMRSLLAEGARLRVHDPALSAATRAELEGLEGDVTCTHDEYEAAEGADGLVVATDWSQFKAPDFGRLGSTLRQPVIFDGRNLYDPDVLAEHGLLHYSVGRRGPDSLTCLRHEHGQEEDA